MTVSVILPVYNSEKTISESIRSILDQSYTDFELIIIDDGSIDDSASIINEFEDSRISFHQNKQNLRLIATLNIGIGMAKGKYIIRMDADDIMLKDRIKEQVAFMEKNKQIVASGTYVCTFGNKSVKWNHLPTNNEEILLFGLFDSPILHPTAIIRKKILDENKIWYDADYLHAEDYKLWLELANHGELGNLKKCLLMYRLSENQITNKYTEIQIGLATKIRREYIARTLIKNGLTPLNSFEFTNTVSYQNQAKKRLNLLSSFDKKCVLSILFIYYMSMDKYSWKSLTYFIFSLVWSKKEFRFKHFVLIILKHINPNEWKWYSIK